MSAMRILAFAALLLFSSALSSQETRPNFLIIQVDDMGYDDLSVNGNTVSNTPTIDELAHQSVRFNNFMVHSVCAPTRASLLTGRDFWKTGVSAMHGGKDFLNLDETTFADILSDSGYVSGMWGKWHSGKADGYWPWDRGFNEAYYAKLYHYYPSDGWYNNYDFYNNIVTHEGRWSAEVLADYAIDFINRKKDSTFLAYVSFLTCHETWAAPEEYIAKYREEGRTEKFATLLAMLEYMDVQVARILQTLSDLGLDENTVVMFMSDNGPNLTVTTAEEWALRNNHGFLGNKSRLWQNGIKSPLYVRWTDQYQASDVNRLTCVTDILPTLLDIAGVGIPEENKALDGRSIKPYLEGDTLSLEPGSGVFANWFPIWEEDQYQPVSAEQREAMNFDAQRLTLINEEYKFLMNPINVDGSPSKLNNDVLIDLLTDPMESTNVASAHPAVVTEMEQELASWFDEVKACEGAFNAPTLQVGLEDKGRYEIPGMVPCEVRGVRNASHQLYEYDEVGDEASYELLVHRPGVYRLNMNANESQLKGYTFSVTVGENSLKKDLISASSQDLGKLILPRGPQMITISLSGIDASQAPSFGYIARYWLYYESEIPPKPDDVLVTTSETICEEDSILFRGDWLKESGEYRDTVRYNYFADSIFVLDLEVVHCKPDPVVIRSDTLICEGDSAFFRGSWYGESGRYRDTVQSTVADTIYQFTLSTQDCVFAEESHAPSPYLVKPNPVRHYFTVQSGEELPFELQLISISGRQLLVRKPAISHRANVEAYQPGLYILKMTTEKTVCTQSLIIN